MLARWQPVIVEASAMRRVLNKEGYYYLPRESKPKYDAKRRKERVAFAELFSTSTAAGQKDKCNICMDGVVFTRPPSTPAARENYIHSETPKAWRRKHEHHPGSWPGMTSMRSKRCCQGSLPSGAGWALEVLPLFFGTSSGRLKMSSGLQQ